MLSPEKPWDVVHAANNTIWSEGCFAGLGQSFAGLSSGIATQTDSVG